MEISDGININDYINKNYNCSCGKIHSCQIKDIIIKNDAIKSLVGLLDKNNSKYPYIIYDKNTYSATGKKIENLLKKYNIKFKKIIISHNDVIASEEIIGETLINYDNKCDLIIGVGSGTINDIGKFISYKIKIPYIVVATAPSVDGFASDCAPLIVKNMKVTYEAKVPDAIIGDVEVLKNAPMDMIAAGVGDILGKYTCLVDWKLSSMVSGEYYCETVVGIVRKAIDIVVNETENILKREDDSIRKVMEALILSGIAMSYTKNSRPASGSEHHLSHYWEMMFMFQGKKAVLHGRKVGVGTVEVCKLYERLIDSKIDFKRARELAKKFSLEYWEEGIRKVYFNASEGVIELEKNVHKNSSENVLKRIDYYENHWNELKNFISKNVPSSIYISNILEKLNAPSKYEDIELSEEIYIYSIVYAKELRNRLGLLQILYDLKVSDYYN